MKVRKIGDYFLHTGYSERKKAFHYWDFKQFGQYAHIDRQVDVKRDHHTAWLDW